MVDRVVGGVELRYHPVVLVRDYGRRAIPHVIDNDQDNVIFLVVHPLGDDNDGVVPEGQ